MLKIIKFPDTILRETMPDFDFVNPIKNPKELEQEMIETMLSHQGMGLAANQVGVPTRAFVMGHRVNAEAEPYLMNDARIQTWSALYDRSIANIKKNDLGSTYPYTSINVTPR